ncbi:MAG: cation:proton antiporter [Acidimicrobiales bacterium]
MLIPIEEHELLVFWVQLFVLLLFAHGFGWAMQKVGLPMVIGQLMAGLVLGPSVFGEIWPEGFEWFLPIEHGEVQSAALLAVAWVGIGLLLVVTGFETDLDLIVKLGRPAALVTAGSLLVPLAAGLGVGYALPDSFLGEGVERLTFALFVALALSVSSLAVVAKILSEMGLMRRDFGQITIAAGMANDVVGWMLLGVFTGLAASGESGGGGAGDVILTIVGLIAFVVAALTLGQRAVDGSLKRVRASSGSNVFGALVVAVLFMLGFGVITQWLGVEAVLGAFVAGIILHRSRFQQPEVIEQFEGLTFAFFAPIFFATAGLRLDLTTLNSAEALAWTFVVIVVGIVFKFAGAYAGGRWAGLSHRAGLALGAGLNARGALEIVIGTVALTLGVFNTTSFTVIVLVPVITSIFASVSLRFVVRDFTGSAAEVARLERERALEENLVVRNSRLLLPSRGGPASIAMAQLMHFAWPEEAGATVLAVGNQSDIDLEPLQNVLHGREVEVRREFGVDPAEAILAEANLGFGVIGLGADAHDTQGVISELVDDVISRSPVPVVTVRRGRNLNGPLPGAFTRAVVPVGRSRGSRAAQEIAFNLSANLGTEIQLAHVVTSGERTAPRWLPFVRPEEPDTIPEEVGTRLLWQAVDQARGIGVEAHPNSLTASAPAPELLRFVDDVDADLVIVGAVLRRLDDRPSLGPIVETVLADCDATVAVVVVPFDL